MTRLVHDLRMQMAILDAAWRLVLVLVLVLVAGLVAEWTVRRALAPATFGAAHAGAPAQQ